MSTNQQGIGYLYNELRQASSKMSVSDLARVTGRTFDALDNALKNLYNAQAVVNNPATGGAGGDTIWFAEPTGEVHLTPASRIADIISLGTQLTDVGGPGLASLGAISVITAAANASVCGLFAAGGRAGISSSHTGSGANLPLCFDVAGSERARFSTGGELQIGLTSSDVGGASIVAASTINVVTAALNASLIGLSCTGGRSSIASSKTGTGTNLPLCFDVAASERARIQTTGELLIGLTSSDVTGAGSIISSNTINCVTATVNASVCGLFTVAATRVGLSSSKTGAGTQLPLCFDVNASERVRLQTTGEMLVGLSSSDVTGAGSIISNNTINCVTGTVNASLCGLFTVAGTRVGLSSSKTGSGTNLPLCFDVAGAERARFDTSGRLMIGLTSTDIANGSLITLGSNGYFGCVSATTNASTLIMQLVPGSFGSIGTNATGSGAQLPFQIYTSGSERMRVLSNAATVLIGQSSTDVTGTSLVCSNTINVVTSTLNASICGLFCVAGARAGIASSHTGSGTNLPLCFDCAGAERMRITTGGLVYINRTTDDGTGATLQVNGSISVNGTVLSVP